MAGEKIQRYISLNATQPGADTFVQASASTNIVPEDGLVYKVLGIDVQLSAAIQGIATDCACYWSFSRDTKTGLCALSDPDCMLMDGFAVALTTSGAVRLPATYRYSDMSALYIVEPTIYLQVSSGTTGLVNIVNSRIYYEEVKMSEVEILRILNNS